MSREGRYIQARLRYTIAALRKDIFCLKERMIVETHESLDLVMVVMSALSFSR